MFGGRKGAATEAEKKDAAVQRQIAKEKVKDALRGFNDVMASKIISAALADLNLE